MIKFVSNLQVLSFVGNTNLMLRTLQVGNHLQQALSDNSKEVFLLQTECVFNESVVYKDQGSRRRPHNEEYCEWSIQTDEAHGGGYVSLPHLYPANLKLQTVSVCAP